ncbi:MAG: cell division protein FtsZ [Verrucomicrobiota bacterium]|jgi:cell division protein FtsZ
MTTPLEIPGQPAIRKKLSLRVFGIGGAGCNAAGFASHAAFAEVDFLAINTDSQSLDACPAPAKFVLGATRMRGLGAGGDPDLGRAAAEDDLEKVRDFCAGADIIFLLAGLGGGTGTGAAPVIARVARESGALVLALVTLPFEFEGGRRQLQAQSGLQQLKAAADAVICLPNQKLFKLLDEKTSVLEGFKISNSLLTEGLRGIWRLLTQTGLINVDFADLCSVTRGRHAASLFATAEASGEKRAEQAMEKLLAHPLLDGGQVLTESDSVLISIAGGPDLMMSEINKLMEPLKRQCENAHIIFGAAIDQQFAGRLSITLIASGQPDAQAPLLAVPPSYDPGASAPLEFLDPAAKERPASRFIAPPPALSDEKKEQLFRGQAGRSRKRSSRLQKELPLEIVFKGRFEKSEPTIRRGEDLDVPTYIRRGVPLN